MYNIKIKNNTNLPFLLEYWNKKKIIYPDKKRELILNEVIIDSFQEYNLFSVRNEYYISSLFSENDKNYKKIWEKNNLPNEMIFTIYLDNSNDNSIKNNSNNFYIKNIDKIFNIFQV